MTANVRAADGRLLTLPNKACFVRRKFRIGYETFFFAARSLHRSQLIWDFLSLPFMAGPQDASLPHKAVPFGIAEAGTA